MSVEIMMSDIIDLNGYVIRENQDIIVCFDLVCMIGCVIFICICRFVYFDMFFFCNVGCLVGENIQEWLCFIKVYEEEKVWC